MVDGEVYFGGWRGHLLDGVKWIWKVARSASGRAYGLLTLSLSEDTCTTQIEEENLEISFIIIDFTRGFWRGFYRPPMHFENSNYMENIMGGCKLYGRGVETMLGMGRKWWSAT